MKPTKTEALHGVELMPIKAEPIDIVKIIRIIVCVILVITSAYFALSPLPLLGLIPGISALSYIATLWDTARTENYRYMDWVLTTPLMLLAVLMNNPDALNYVNITMVLNVIMIGCGYFGIKEVNKTKKLMWFLLGTAIFIPIASVLLSMPYEKQLSYFLIGTWTVYPLIWILKANYVIKEDATNIAYSLMDVISKVGLVNMINI